MFVGHVPGFSVLMVHKTSFSVLQLLKHVCDERGHILASRPTICKVWSSKSHNLLWHLQSKRNLEHLEYYLGYSRSCIAEVPLNVIGEKGDVILKLTEFRAKFKPGS